MNTVAMRENACGVLREKELNTKIKLTATR
jgi:hypothetical protein